MEKDSERITELETKVAYQEYTIKQLNDVVCEQQAQIDTLLKFVDKLKEHLNVSSDGGNIFKPEDEVPPHY